MHPDRVLLTICLLLSCFRTTWAHDLPISNLLLVADEDYLHLEIVLNAAELNFIAEIDQDKNGQLSPGEVQTQGEQISGRLLEFIDLEVNGRLVHADVHGIVPAVDTHHLSVRAHYPSDARQAPIAFTSRLAAITRDAHVVQVTLRRPTGVQLARIDAYGAKVSFDSPTEVRENGSADPSLSSASGAAAVTRDPSGHSQLTVLAVAVIVLSGLVLLIRHYR